MKKLELTRTKIAKTIRKTFHNYITKGQTLAKARANCKMRKFPTPVGIPHQKGYWDNYIDNLHPHPKAVGYLTTDKCGKIVTKKSGDLPANKASAVKLQKQANKKITEIRLVNWASRMNNRL